MSEAKRKYHDALDDLLDRPIAYNPAFKKITGSTVAGIFLSQAWYWSKRHADGWFWKTQKEWEDETGLTRHEQDTARKHCLRVGVIEEDLKGVPATVHYKVNKQKVYELLGVQFAETRQTEIAAIRQTSSRKSGKQDRRVTANFNKVTETPTENSLTDEQISVLQNAGLEWLLLSGQPITQEVIDQAILEQSAKAEFEKTFGFGTLPWSSTDIWTKFGKFIISLFQKDPAWMKDYVYWRENEGKYKAFSNRKIRENPVAFMDTGYPEYEASKMYRKTDDERPAYKPFEQKEGNYVTNPDPARAADVLRKAARNLLGSLGISDPSTQS
jgi:hypothetical protein